MNNMTKYEDQSRMPRSKGMTTAWVEGHVSNRILVPRKRLRENVFYRDKSSVI